MALKTGSILFFIGALLAEAAAADNVLDARKISASSISCNDGDRCHSEAEPSDEEASLLLQVPKKQLELVRTGALSEDARVRLSVQSPVRGTGTALRDIPADEGPGTEHKKHQETPPRPFAMVIVGALLAYYVVSCLWSLYRRLPAWPLGPSNVSLSGLPASQRYAEEVSKTMIFDTWFDVIQSSDAPLIREIGGEDVAERPPLTYAQLHEFVHSGNTAVSKFGVSRTDRVCTMIPNGPEAAVCFLVLPTRCVFAPLNPALSAAEVDFEFDDLPCHTLILKSEGGQVPTIPLKAAAARSIQVLDLVPRLNDAAGLFSLKFHEDTTVRLEALPQDEWNRRGDLALVLHTSGTTKKPKIVPLTIENLVVGAMCIKSTLQREHSDICLNLMPLYHIHGISVNVLATAFAGASVICSSGYPGPAGALRWLNESGTPLWYSAVPTMHQGIVEVGEAALREGQELPSDLRMIRNCSAALVPVVAERMEALFGCIVLGTYAMSESMPIASNPLPPHVRSLRSVGLAAGPQIQLQGDDGSEPARGGEAEVCVSGACVTKGYEVRAHMDEDPNIAAFTSAGWLRTGDKGYIDEQGHLCLSGRFKEIINRGGEKLSPFEVENAMRQHESVLDCMAFLVPHTQLGETVGLAVVPRPGKDLRKSHGPEALTELRAFVERSGCMSLQWAPECLVFMAEIPKGSTGKPARIGFAQRHKLPTIDAAHPQPSAVWDTTSGSAVLVLKQAEKEHVSKKHEESATQKQSIIGEEKSAVVDSLGMTTVVSRDDLLLLRTVRSLYGVAACCIVLFHVSPYHFDKRYFPNSPAWERVFAGLVGGVRPVAAFALCYGYFEGAERRFLFGNCTREIALVVLIGCHGLLKELLAAAWYTITGWTMTYESGNPFRLAGLHWFLGFILIARIVMLCLHRIGIPGWLQLCGACAVGKLRLVERLPFWPGPPLIPKGSWRLNSENLCYVYALFALGAYYGPTVVGWAQGLASERGLTSGWRRIVIRTVAAGCLLMIFTEGETMRWLVGIDASVLQEGNDTWALTLFFDVFWTCALVAFVSPGIWIFEITGRYALGAYLFGTVIFANLFKSGFALRGLRILPPLSQVGQALAGGPPRLSLMAFLPEVLVYIYFACLLGGVCLHVPLESLMQAGTVLARKTLRRRWCD
eukprot:gnl/TRDRNA2_/TRDRNA2_186348_c0_seq1.p1 gnl/TRDRNA2_/TRDRNA2_186348_c0~~gnl/TRDRNA2_/TRDRNA2_186348_c0_seq1.p1  ORF type:complete len:1158 (-),score=153.33 gnl/TRDRNA2_/TRDRNA2_186348_c0_seq1:131-3604(-)